MHFELWRRITGRSKNVGLLHGRPYFFRISTPVGHVELSAAVLKARMCSTLIILPNVVD